MSLLFGIANQAQAGYFGALTKLFGFDKKEIEKQMNTTDMPLLASAVQSGTDENTTLVVPGLLTVESGPLRISTEPELIIPDDDIVSIYTVKPGDTLNSVAELFNVSVNTIVWANDIGTRKIVPGQVLTILPISGTRHVITKSDTLESIAKKYGANVEDIALYNGLNKNSALSLGDKILVPDGTIQDQESPIEKKADKKLLASDLKKKVSDTKIGKTALRVVKNLTSAGYFVRPIRGGVETTGLHGRNAVDLAAPVGTPIYAAAAGSVITVKTGGYNGGYGNYVVIAHANGTQTLYAHNSANAVSVGQKVAQGEQIASVGSTGKSTGPHVHFEVRGGVNPF